MGNTINVVFPVVNLSTLSDEEGFAGDPEGAQQVNAIDFYVHQINAAGGIHGRKIHAIIARYDPTDEVGMRALCKDWTEGSPPVFAVVDGLGAWTGDNELCVSQEGHTPFIGEWTTVTDWTTKGSPYLWWLGADQAAILSTLVSWAASAGYIGTGKTLGIVAGDRASDQLALNDYLLPDLKKAGVVAPGGGDHRRQPHRRRHHRIRGPSDHATLPGRRCGRRDPVDPLQRLLPLPAGRNDRGLLPPAAAVRLRVDHQHWSRARSRALREGPRRPGGGHRQTLGGIDDDRPESKGGYDPGVRSCFNSFRKSSTYPFPAPPVHPGPWIEEQGPIASWCQGIRLFADAAEKAGRHLNRRTFVEAMARVENYPGTLESDSQLRARTSSTGRSEYRVVRIHNNSASDNGCINNYQGRVQATCWQVVQNWKPLVH